MRKKFILFFILIFAVAMASGGCDLFDDIVLNMDIPADPGTEPPPPAEGSLSPTFSARVLDADNPQRVALNLGGLIDPGTRETITYSKDNVTVIENDVVKGIKVTSLGGDTVLKADIVFIIDTTGSMGPYITGVTNSVLSFFDFLDASGLDIRAGALAYADCIPPADNPAGIPADDRAAYTVVGYTPLDADLSEDGDPYTFVEGLYASYLGYHGGMLPEGLFDSVWWAYENYDFRPDAQKIFVVITDASSWGAGEGSGEIAPDCPWTDANLASELRGDVTVHVVSNENIAWELGAYSGSYDPRYLAEPGGPNDSPGTGGIWYPLAIGAEIDLTDLPIGEVTTASALVEFLTADPHGEHTLRVIVEGPTEDGETTRVVRYLD